MTKKLAEGRVCLTIVPEGYESTLVGKCGCKQRVCEQELGAGSSRLELQAPSRE